MMHRVHIVGRHEHLFTIKPGDSIDIFSDFKGI